MRVLVTGSNGQLGYDVAKRLVAEGNEVICTGFSDEPQKATNREQLNSIYYRMDITSEYDVEKVFELVNPQAVIHCAAWTNVDEAEIEENRKAVWDTNVSGTQNISIACKKYNCSLVYISTDYVFDGEGHEPWKENTKVFNPLNEYGRSKLAGENVVKNTLDKYFIVRISWVFGINGKNFVKTMLEVGKKRSVLKVVDDQIGSPTYTVDLAGFLSELIKSDRYGIYHASNDGEYISWYEFAKEIFSLAHYDTNVIPVSTVEYGLRGAARPLNSRLEKKNIEKNGFIKLPEWEDALKRFLAELRDNGFILGGEYGNKEV